MLSLIPSKTQWRKWNLPTKIGYIGAWCTIIGTPLGFIIALVLYHIPTSREPSAQSIRIEEKVDTLADSIPSTVTAITEQVLFRMDTNRVRIEMLSQEILALKDKGSRTEAELIAKQNQLAVALTTIDELQVQLASVAKASDLSASNQTRLNTTLAVAEQAKPLRRITARTVKAGTVKVRGR